LLTSGGCVGQIGSFLDRLARPALLPERLPRRVLAIKNTLELKVHIETIQYVAAYPLAA
jgi:hypothetical protein